MNTTGTAEKEVPKMVGARLNELAPLVERWMKKNPGVPTSKLVQRGLRLALKDIAGKRYEHLVQGEVA